MLRWTFHILTLMSLVLMIASCVAWVRSGWNSENVVRQGGNGLIAAGYTNGRCMLFELVFHEGDIPISWHWWSTDEGIDAADSFLNDATASIRLGAFEYHTIRPADNHPTIKKFTIVFVPIWFMTLLFTILPMWWLLAYRKRSKGYRLKRGLCLTCGYDMRASPDTCPECGHTT